MYEVSQQAEAGGSCSSGDGSRTCAADASLVLAETAHTILALLGTLTTRLQQVIRLYYLEEKSYRGIARLLQIDPVSVRKQKFRALGQLKKVVRRNVDD